MTPTRMKGRLVAAMVVVVALAGSLAGCGGCEGGGNAYGMAGRCSVFTLPM